MDIKPGVKVHGVSNEMVLCAVIVNSVFVSYGITPVITSVCEGVHSKTSLHYTGDAIDFRRRDIPVKTISSLVHSLKQALGADYDVVLEKTHIHVEFQPKGGIT
jgi:uncharacterized protein YcbK (DUF882 family)